MFAQHTLVWGTGMGLVTFSQRTPVGKRLKTNGNGGGRLGAKLSADINCFLRESFDIDAYLPPLLRRKVD